MVRTRNSTVAPHASPHRTPSIAPKAALSRRGACKFFPDMSINTLNKRVDWARDPSRALDCRDAETEPPTRRGARGARRDLSGKQAESGLAA